MSERSRVLPHQFRLRRRVVIQSTVRRGSYSRGRCLAVHYLSSGDAAAPPRVAFAVGKPVGNAVVRNRVARRMRHLMAARIGQLPPGGYLVVRALRPAATATSESLSHDLDRTVPAAVRGARQRPSARP